MRFDVPFAFLLGAASAAGIPRPHRAGLAVDRQTGRNRVLEAEKEIEQLEKKLLHDLEELEHKQHQQQQYNNRPGPYWQPPRPQWTSVQPAAGYESSSAVDSISIPAASATQSSENAAITTSASDLLTSSISVSVGSASYINSAANTTEALQSLSSAAASLSSVISSVSSVNATVTLATSSSTLAFAPETTSVVGTAVSSSTIVSAQPVYSSNSTFSSLSTAAPFANSSYTGASATGANDATVSLSQAAGQSTDSVANGAAQSSSVAQNADPSGSSSGSPQVTSTDSVVSTITVSSTGTVTATVSTSAQDVNPGNAASSTSSTPTASLTSAAYPFANATSIILNGTAASASAVFTNNTSVAPIGTAVSSSVYAANTTSVYIQGTAASKPVVSANSTSVAFAGTAVSTPVVSANSTSVAFAGTAVSTPVVSANATSVVPAGTGASKPFDAGNSTIIFASGTASGISMAPTSSALANISNAAVNTSCASLCSALTLDTEYSTVPISCEAIPANTEYTITGGQATAGCGSTSTTSFTPSVDICRVTLSITTTGESETYMEVWLPNNGTDAWNGRTLSTDNGGANGCVHYVDMEYVSSLGFAAVGDNGGHNSSAFDAGWMYFQNEVILDWVYRARHASIAAGKQVVDQFYGQAPSFSYYLGCSTGGQQGLHSAQYYPDDFDGIIAGSAAADFNHLQAWTGRFIQLTGTNSSDARYLTEDQWVFVQSYIFDQCDEALDGVNDGILEDPTICQFDASVIPVCGDNATDSCLTSTQINTVEQVFTELYNTDGELLYPSLLYGSQVDAFRLGLVSGSTQAIATDWYAGGVWNDSFYDAANMNQTDYAQADSLDELHGHVSSYNGDLSAFEAAGGKLLMYHGMADPLVSGGNSQRYYLKVAKTLGLDNTGLDPFFRYFRISGMAHCGVGGISGAGAWMFGQNGEAAVEGVADNVIWNMVDWVENGNAPDTLTGTKFWYDTPADGVEFERNHCRFPYRTTYSGSGDSTDPANWSCVFIDDWQDCAVGAHPRLCNVDGSFN